MTEITVNIKCSNADKATITIDKTATVVEMKEKIGETLSVPASQQRLIYKGRVLKDDLTVEHYDIQDGHTVHMVKGAAQPAVNNTTVASATAAPIGNTVPASSARPASNVLSPANMFGSMGGPANGGGQDVNRMQEQLLRNPEMMQQIMNSPMMDHMLNNPDLMRNMMGNNPQMQALMDSNPQIRHMMNDPAVRFKRYYQRVLI